MVSGLPPLESVSDCAPGHALQALAVPSLWCSRGRWVDAGESHGCDWCDAHFERRLVKVGGELWRVVSSGAGCSACSSSPGLCRPADVREMSPWFVCLVLNSTGSGWRLAEEKDHVQAADVGCCLGDVSKLPPIQFRNLRRAVHHCVHTLQSGDAPTRRRRWLVICLFGWVPALNWSFTVDGGHKTPVVLSLRSYQRLLSSRRFGWSGPRTEWPPRSCSRSLSTHTLSASLRRCVRMRSPHSTLGMWSRRPSVEVLRVSTSACLARMGLLVPLGVVMPVLRSVLGTSSWV